VLAVAVTQTVKIELSPLAAKQLRELLGFFPNMRGAELTRLYEELQEVE
jgi:hypothetical protein